MKKLYETPKADVIELVSTNPFALLSQADDGDESAGSAGSVGGYGSIEDGRDF